MPRRGRRHPRGRRRLGDRHGQVRLGRRAACRSCTCRRRTRVPSGRRSTASARPTGACRAAARARRRSAIVYDVELTLDLPPSQSAGTAMNALAHCAEALYVEGHNADADVQALAGARAHRGGAAAVSSPTARDRDAREELLRGATHAGRALALAGLGLGHAMAQALGGRFGTPHGAMNALCLPPALELQPRRTRRRRCGASAPRSRGDAVERARELAQLGGFNRLRDAGIPEDELPETSLPRPRSGQATWRIRAPPPPRRSRRCCARSGETRPVRPVRDFPGLAVLSVSEQCIRCSNVRYIRAVATAAIHSTCS